MSANLRIGVLAIVLGILPAVAAAQTQGTAKSMVEGHVGQAWFLDESAIRHDVVGIGVSRAVSARVRLRATLTHMRGPGRDRDWLALGHVSFDIVQDRHPAVPFVAAGLGLLRHTNTDYGRDIAGTGPAVLLTAGVRVRLRDRWFVAPEASFGWEPHTRLGITFGVRR